jgi:DUF1680 family protein
MKTVMTLGILASMAMGAAAGDDWWNPAWKLRQRVSINASEISEDLVGFPLGFRLTDAEAAQLWTNGGRDLRIVAADGAVLPCEVVRGESGVVEVYVQIPKIAAKTPGQHVDLYYGNPDAEALPPASPWDDRYRFVLHLAGNLNDAKTQQPAATVQGGVVLKDVAKFDADPCFLNIDPKLIHGIGEQITISVRFRIHGGPTVQTLASGRRTDDREEWFNFGLKLPDIVHTNATSKGQRAPELNPQGIAPDEWHCASVRYDARNHTRTICIDGVVLERDASLPGPLEVQEMRIGRGVLHFDPWQFHGEIDEVRVSDVARSDSWMRAEAGCLGEKSTFLGIGVPQEYGKPAPPPAAFSLLVPRDGTQTRSRSGVRVQWRLSAGAERYTVQVFADDKDSKPVAEFDAGAATGFVIPGDAFAGKTIYWSVIAHSETGVTKAVQRWRLSGYDWSKTMTTIPQDKKQPVLSPAREAALDLRGYLRTRIDKCIARYFLETPESSPAILQVLRDRDKTPVRDPLVPWAGEFAGKFLTGAQLTWRLTHDEALKRAVDDFVRDLLACQAPNGYLGPFPESSRLTGGNWDVWGHYHCMLGLLLYYEDTGYAPALDACKKMADLLFETFGPGGPTLTCDGAGGQMNMALCHSLVLLYKKTGVDCYLELAKYIIHDAWNEDSAGKYLESALAGKRVHEFPQHRWEALHDYQALPEMYWLTGDDQYLRAFEQIWWSGVEGDRHNTGGVTSGEGFCGSPYNPGAIETCCTVAWIAVSIDMLRLTGDSRVADEIEWSTLNSALGAIPYSGRTCAYNVPMDGTRTFGVELPWQSPKAGPDLNCCAVNAYRPLGMIAQWALMQRAEGLALNFYGPASLSATLASGNKVTLEEDTRYPADGGVKITVKPDKPERFTLDLRIPRWSKTTAVRVNGQDAGAAVPGTYFSISREWKSGDAIEIAFDFRLHFWAGEQECANKISVYRGPILYAYDARYNDLNPDQIPVLDWASAKLQDAAWEGKLEPWALATLTDKSGAALRVCDLSSAGQTGNHYRSWLPAKDLPPSPFNLLAPAEGASAAPFRWEKRGGAESWTVIVGASRDFSGAKRVEVREAAETAIELQPGEYYWTVVASNAFGAVEAANGPRRGVVK